MDNRKIVIVDVRTPQEFETGHVAGSINIPLQEVVQRLDEFKCMNQPIILCCASGHRSGQVAAFLDSFGIQCENAGCWMDINLTHSTN